MNTNLLKAPEGILKDDHKNDKNFQEPQERLQINSNIDD